MGAVVCCLALFYILFLAVGIGEGENPFFAAITGRVGGVVGSGHTAFTRLTVDLP